MKKFLFAVITLMLLPVVAICQPGDVIPEPTTIIEWIGALPIYLGSWPGVAISFPFLTATVIGLLNQEEASKVVKYLLTGLVGVVLLLLAFFLPFGYLNGAYWWWIPVNFVGLMLVEIIGYVLIGDFLDKIAEKVNPWKPVL